MKKKSLIIIASILFAAAVITVYLVLTHARITAAAISGEFDHWMKENLYDSENYTITMEIPEETTGNRWINLDSLATAPFWSWLDRRLYEGPSTLTIKVSKTTQTASFDDGTDLYFLALDSGQIFTYFPVGDGSYEPHSIKNPKAARTVRSILFSTDKNLFKSIAPAENAKKSDGHIALTRKIESTPFLSSFISADTFPAREAIRVSMEASDSPEPTLTMNCAFARLLADISSLLYNEDFPKSNADIGDYHLKITVSQFDKTEPVVLPDASALR